MVQSILGIKCPEMKVSTLTTNSSCQTEDAIILSDEELKSIENNIQQSDVKLQDMNDIMVDHEALVD